MKDMHLFSRFENRPLKNVHRDLTLSWRESAMAEEKCLGCGKLLFRRVRVDEIGHTVVRANANIALEGEGFERLFRCPSCQTMHIVANRKNMSGIPQLVISHVKK
jgi:hypothetical protein